MAAPAPAPGAPRLWTYWRSSSS
jgi:maleylacetoacetate isomerase